VENKQTKKESKIIIFMIVGGIVFVLVIVVVIVVVIKTRGSGLAASEAEKEKRRTTHGTLSDTEFLKNLDSTAK